MTENSGVEKSQTDSVCWRKPARDQVRFTQLILLVTDSELNLQSNLEMKNPALPSSPCQQTCIFKKNPPPGTVLMGAEPPINEQKGQEAGKQKQATKAQTTL